MFPLRRLRLAGVLVALLLTVACGGAARHGQRSGPQSAGHHPGTESGSGSGSDTDAITAERARPGTAAWQLHSPGPADAVQGYADRVSVRPGERFRLYVSTTAAGFRATAYRMGWYGGAGGREVWQSGPERGGAQAAPAVSHPLNTVSAGWKPSLTVSTTGWPEGDYLILLRADNGHARYVPITVRSPDTRGRVVLLNGVTTWQAYNLWGGYDLYEGHHGFNDRARAVSFDRPYDKNGASKFLIYERPAVELAERLGLPVAYETDTDLATDPHLLDGARALVSLGHDEYWSSSMRDAATRARDAGVNVAFLGANAVNRHIRLGATALGPARLVICYKSASEDPEFVRDPAETTQDWRLPPNSRPEGTLTGAQYDCFPAKADYVVTDPGNWLFAGTGAKAGTRFRDLIGVESDRITAGAFPRPLEVLSISPLTCGNRHTLAQSTYYSTASGAGVFDAGTMNWVPAIGHADRLPAASWSFTTTVTTTLLRAFATGPAGRAHPAQDNTRALTG